MPSLKPAMLVCNPFAYAQCPVYPFLLMHSIASARLPPPTLISLQPAAEIKHAVENALVEAGYASECPALPMHRGPPPPSRLSLDPAAEAGFAIEEVLPIHRKSLTWSTKASCSADCALTHRVSGMQLNVTRCSVGFVLQNVLLAPKLCPYNFTCQISFQQTPCGVLPAGCVVQAPSHIDHFKVVRLRQCYAGGPTLRVMELSSMSFPLHPSSVDVFNTLAQRSF